MSSVWDEVYDDLGKVVSRRERIITEDVPNDLQIQAARAQLLSLLTTPNVPDWGMAIARFVLMTNTSGQVALPDTMGVAADVSDVTDPITPKPSKGPI